MSTSTTADVLDPLSFYLDKSDPAAWKAVGGLSLAATKAAETAGLDARLVELVNLRVSQINGCAYCLHVHTRKAVEAGLTELPELEDLQVAQLSSFAVLTPEQYSAVQWLAITMNVTNRISILSHHPVRPDAPAGGTPSGGTA